MRGQVLCLTSGRAGCVGGWKAQKFVEGCPTLTLFRGGEELRVEKLFSAPGTAFILVNKITNTRAKSHFDARDMLCPTALSRLRGAEIRPRVDLVLVQGRFFSKERFSPHFDKDFLDLRGQEITYVAGNVFLLVQGFLHFLD